MGRRFLFLFITTILKKEFDVFSLMSKHIVIPHHDALVKNSVYRCKGKLIDEGKSQKNSSRLLIFDKFTVPTETEMFRFLVDSARKDGEPDYDVSFLRGLSFEEKERLAEGDDVADSIVSYYDHGLKEGKSYLDLETAIFRSAFLDNAVKKIENSSNESSANNYVSYNHLVHDSGDEAWSLRLELTKNKTLPNKSYVDFALGIGSRDSDLLSVGGDYGRYKDVIRQVNHLYRFLDDPKAMGKVFDSSLFFLYSKASNAVEDFLEAEGRDRELEELPVYSGDRSKSFFEDDDSDSDFNPLNN